MTTGTIHIMYLNKKQNNTVLFCDDILLIIAQFMRRPSLYDNESKKSWSVLQLICKSTRKVINDPINKAKLYGSLLTKFHKDEIVLEGIYNLGNMNIYAEPYVISIVNSFYWLEGFYAPHHVFNVLSKLGKFANPASSKLITIISEAGNNNLKWDVIVKVAQSIGNLGPYIHVQDIKVLVYLLKSENKLVAKAALLSLSCLGNYALCFKDEIYESLFDKSLFDENDEILNFAIYKFSIF